MTTTLDILRFIFSSFWVWAGTMVLLAIHGHYIADIIRALRGTKE